MGPGAFGLEEAFDLSTCSQFSAHIAINVASADPAYSVFWHKANISRWSGRHGGSGWSKQSFRPFGLQELGNISIRNPSNPSLEGAVGNHQIVHLQHYIPTVKALQEKTPLVTKPHLLTFLLGSTYVSRQAKFASTWREVSSGRTVKQLIESNRLDVSLPARFEVVIMEDDPSFLGAFDHWAIVRLFVVDRLLVKVPQEQYPGYVRSLVKELYEPLEADVNGNLTGSGALPTVMLCEGLLSYLPTCSGKDVPRNVLKAYDILPSRSALVDELRIDLCPYASARDSSSILCIICIHFCVLRSMVVILI